MHRHYSSPFCPPHSCSLSLIFSSSCFLSVPSVLSLYLFSFPVSRFFFPHGIVFSTDAKDYQPATPSMITDSVAHSLRTWQCPIKNKKSGPILVTFFSIKYATTLHSVLKECLVLSFLRIQIFDGSRCGSKSTKRKVAHGFEHKFKTNNRRKKKEQSSHPRSSRPMTITMQA